MGKKVFSELQIIMFVAFGGLLLLTLLPVSHDIYKIEEQKKYESNVQEVIEASKKMINNKNLVYQNHYINVDELINSKYLLKTKLSGCIKATYNDITGTYMYNYFNLKCEDIITLKDKLISMATNVDDGLYKINNMYIYKGMNPNNYILIDNVMYRILSIDNDGIKIISNNSIDNKNYDSSTSRNNEDNAYCLGSVNGCNIYMSNGIDVKDDSDLYQYLENVYTNNHNINIVKTNWNLGLIDKIDEDIATLIKSNSITSSIGLLNIHEYMLTNLDGNYTHSWLNNHEDYWTLTGVLGNTNEVWYITSNGEIAKKDANNILGVRPIINLNTNVKAIGEGTIDSPYILR